MLVLSKLMRVGCAMVLTSCLLPTSNGDGSGSGSGSGTNTGSGTGGPTSSSSGQGGASTAGSITQPAAGGSTPSAGGGSAFEDDSGTASTPMPPIIASLTPPSGDYGALITLTGDNLNATGATLVLQTPAGSPLLYRVPASTGDPAGVIKKWTKTEIQFRYPFPAEGTVGVKTAAGQAEAGSFAPSWQPHSPLSGKFSKRELMSVVSPAPGVIAAAFDGTSGPFIVTGDTTSLTAAPFSRGSNALPTAQLYASGGSVGGFFTIGSPPTLWQLKAEQGAITTSNTGVALTADAPVYAGGADAQGVFAWVRKTAGQLVRIRPPSWTQDAGPITEPSSHKSTSALMGVDGSLYVLWGKDVHTFLDDYSTPQAARMRKGKLTFDPAVTLGPSADDYMVWTRGVGAGLNGELTSYYCATDTGFGNPSADCRTGFVDSLGTSSSGDNATPGFGTATTVLARCDAASMTLMFGPSANTSQQVPILFPCPTALAATVDQDGKGLLLVRVGDYLYSPRPRAQ